MGARVTKRDPIPRVTKDNIVQAVEAIKRVVEIGMGRRGDQLDRFPTLRELEASGLIRTLRRNPVLIGGETVQPIDFLPPAGPISFLPPPAPTGFTATPAVISVILDWDDPDAKYKNHSYTEIWRSSTNDIGTATRVGTSNSFVWADSIDDTAGTYYYWIRFVSRANVPGPFNAIAGTAATPDPADTAQIADLAITSAKIANLAVVTAKIADANITEAKIASLAVSTAKIQLAAITTALIQDLAVETIKIGDQAVIIPEASYTSALIDASGGSWVTVASQTITTTSSDPLYLMFSSIIRHTSTSEGDEVQARITRNTSTTVWAAEVIATDLSTTVDGYASPYSLAVVDTPGSGSFTYAVQIMADTSFSRCDVSRRSICILGTKGK